MSPETTVRMANQIAAFFKTQPGQDQVANFALHLSDFWEPRMRRALLDHIAAGGEGLDPLVLDAAKQMRVPA